MALLRKVLTGIEGLDDITGGGLPYGRTTLFCGNAGCGKTLMAMEFMINGITKYNEPGVFISFEETPQQLTENVVSLGFDIQQLIEENKLIVENIYVDRSTFNDQGEYELEGLFLRLEQAMKKINAKRIVLDTLESLFSGIENPAFLRSEIRKLFRWLKEKDVTSVMTVERNEITPDKLQVEEYVSDCVIFLDHRVIDQISTRRLRIIKYRGSAHATNEFPFLINAEGISILPVTSLNLNYRPSFHHISSGIEQLDVMLGKKGYFKGSSILVSGVSGTGKTSIAARFAESICSGGGRCLFFAFEESSKQVIQNMKTINIDLEKHEASGSLLFLSSSPTLFGLESHLVSMISLIRNFKPDAVIIDPITNLNVIGSPKEVKLMLTRLIYYLKAKGHTSLLTAELHILEKEEFCEEHVSSLIDTWILLKTFEENKERKKGLVILKSRGMNHSNSLVEYSIKESGIELHAEEKI